MGLNEVMLAVAGRISNRRMWPPRVPTRRMPAERSTAKAVMSADASTHPVVVRNALCK
jgi:hypothetical protein